SSPLRSFPHAPPTPAISPLSLHDALPILALARALPRPRGADADAGRRRARRAGAARRGPRRRVGARRRHAAVSARAPRRGLATRSEEHTSELQSRENLVCRLLLEKKKNKQ